jgi:hypothetical protein
MRVANAAKALRTRTGAKLYPEDTIPGMLAQHRDGVKLAGGVGAPIIGANDQATLTDIVENPRQVIVRLRRLPRWLAGVAGEL